MRARTSLGRNAVLATLIACGSAHGTDAVPSCRALPEVAKVSEPELPPSVESRGLPNPVTILVEFTLHHDGSVSNPIVIEDDAGSYATKFRAQALQSVLRTRFRSGTPKCRGRLKVSFKVVSGPHA
jgi:hypothetical protein